MTNKKEITVEELIGADRPTADVFGEEDLAKEVITAKNNLTDAKEEYDEVSNDLKDKARNIRNEYEAESSELFDNVRFDCDNDQRVDIQFSYKTKKLTKKVQDAMEKGLTEHMREQLVVEERKIVVTGPAVDDILEYLEDIDIDEKHFAEVKELVPVENAEEKLKKLEAKLESNGEIERSRRVALNLFRKHIEPELSVNVRAKS